MRLCVLIKACFPKLSWRQRSFRQMFCSNAEFLYRLGNQNFVCRPPPTFVLLTCWASLTCSMLHKRAASVRSATWKRFQLLACLCVAVALLCKFTQTPYHHCCVCIQASQTLLKLQASLWESHRTPQGVSLTLSLGVTISARQQRWALRRVLNNSTAKQNKIHFTVLSSIGCPCSVCVAERQRERGRSLFLLQMAPLFRWPGWGWGGWARHRMHSLSNSQHSPLHCLSYEALFMLYSPVPFASAEFY